MNKYQLIQTLENLIMQYEWELDEFQPDNKYDYDNIVPHATISAHIGGLREALGLVKKLKVSPEDIHGIK